MRELCAHIIEEMYLFGFYHIFRKTYGDGGGGECIATRMPR